MTRHQVFKRFARAYWHFQACIVRLDANDDGDSIARFDMAFAAYMRAWQAVQDVAPGWRPRLWP